MTLFENILKLLIQTQVMVRIFAKSYYTADMTAITYDDSFNITSRDSRAHVYPGYSCFFFLLLKGHT